MYTLFCGCKSPLSGPQRATIRILLFEIFSQNYSTFEILWNAIAVNSTVTSRLVNLFTSSRITPQLDYVQLQENTWGFYGHEHWSNNLPELNIAMNYPPICREHGAFREKPIHLGRMEEVNMRMQPWLQGHSWPRKWSAWYQKVTKWRCSNSNWKRRISKHDYISSSRAQNTSLHHFPTRGCSGWRSHEENYSGISYCNGWWELERGPHSSPGQGIPTLRSGGACERVAVYSFNFVKDFVSKNMLLCRCGVCGFVFQGLSASQWWRLGMTSLQAWENLT